MNPKTDIDNTELSPKENNSEKTQIELLIGVITELIQGLKNNPKLPDTPVQYAEELEVIGEDAFESAIKDNPTPVIIHRDNEAFLIKGIVAELVGAGGIGKSHLLAQLALSVSTGLKFLDTNQTDKPGHVLLAVAENTKNDGYKLLNKIGKKLYSAEDLKKIHKYLSIQSFYGVESAFVDRYDKPTEAFNRFMSSLKKREPEEGWSLIILDPISRFVGPETETKNTSATKFLKLLEQSIHQLKGKPTFLFSHHMSKSAINSTELNQTAGRGASAITDCARFQITLDRVKDNKILQQVKENERAALRQLVVTKNNVVQDFKKQYLIIDKDGVLRNKELKSKKLELFKSVESNENFGIPRELSDPMSKLGILLSNAEIKKTGNSFLLTAETKNSNKDIIRLEYELESTSQEEAITEMDKYKKKITGTSLKAWMALWKMANNMHSPTFSSNMIDVMKILGKDRKSRFYSTKEKDLFYKDIKILSRTRFKIFKDKKWIVVPILVVDGIKDSYTKRIHVRLFNEGKFVPAIFRNETLGLHCKNVFSAFVDQNRAAQLSWGNKPIQKNLETLITENNLEKTANKNRSVAKMCIINKYRRYKEKGIIMDFSVNDGGIQVIPIPQKEIKPARDISPSRIILHNKMKRNRISCSNSLFL